MSAGHEGSNARRRLAGIVALASVLLVCCLVALSAVVAPMPPPADRSSAMAGAAPGVAAIDAGDPSAVDRAVDRQPVPLAASPAVVVPVGGLAIRRGLMLRRRLDECIGSVFPFGEAVAVPLPHPSGASRWLNDPQNRKRVERATAALRRELRNAKAFASA